MAHISYSASAPGTLMLLGEHAVLQDKPAIVLAIDKRIKIFLKTRVDTKIVVNSDLGKIEFELDQIKNLQEQKSLGFVLAAIQYFKKLLIIKNQGFELNIESEFSHECGLGSSAAVTVAMVAVLSKFINDKSEANQEKLFETARHIIRDVQGVGSGADVAASVYGGVIVYQQRSPAIVKKIDQLLPLVVIYSGSKTPTPEVIKKVVALKNQYPELIASLYDAMEHAVTRAAVLIENQAWRALGEVMNIQQGIMNALGVGTPVLNQIVDALNSQPDIYGAKISGAGLGDCVIGLGDVQRADAAEMRGLKKIPLAVSVQGVAYG
jgi:mevalonate kinase